MIHQQQYTSVQLSDEVQRIINGEKQIDISNLTKIPYRTLTKHVNSRCRGELFYKNGMIFIYTVTAF